MKPVDKKYNFLRPVKTPNLVRIGRKGDGGYVVDSKVIKETNLLITFGLGPDWSFELDYISKNPTKFFLDKSLLSQTTYKLIM